MLTSVTGINWGDEGKGRIVDLLTEKADYVVRYQGGNNAGHTVVTDQGKFVLNLLPSGILHPTAVCVLGNGMVIDPDHLRHEIAMMQYMKVKVDASNLKISDKATICMPFHVRQDVLEEERLSKTGSAFGSTRRGIAYAYGDKYMKKTLRMGDLLELDAPSVQHRLKVIIDSKNLVLENVYNQEPLSYDEIMEWCRSQAEFFKDYICDVGTLLGAAAGQGKNILFEAQLGALRDIDYGIYPFTSSSNTIRKLCPDRCRYSGLRARQRGRRHESIFHMRMRGTVCSGDGDGRSLGMKNCGRAAESSAQQQADRAVSDRLTLLQAVTASGARRRRISH